MKRRDFLRRGSVVAVSVATSRKLLQPLAASEEVSGELLALTAQQSPPTAVEDLERAEARRWLAAKFEGNAEPRPARGYLMTHLRSEQVQKNGVTTKGYGIYPTGRSPLRIADKVYARGLYCPSEGPIVVHLPGPAKMFEAIVGVDSNQVMGFYSNAGRGRAIATVEAGDKVVFRSGVMREGLPGIPVKVELGDATQFTLRLQDASGGTIERIDFNQADWAEACVTLTDGRTLWLGDLPLGPLPEAYTTQPPFSFRYGDKPFSMLLENWEVRRRARLLDENRTEHTLTFRCPRTGLEVRCVAVEYHDFPAVEWTLYFKNIGKSQTPILESLQALDTRFERDGDAEFLLHYNKGCPHSMLVAPAPTDFQPFEVSLPPNAERRFSGEQGLPAGNVLPFFNLELPGEGIIIAVGWPGQWAGEFRRDDSHGLQVRIGQQLTHFKLLPGEEARTPLIAMLFWKGEWMRSQNIWRRWMIAHNMPRPAGKLPSPQIAAGSSAQYIEMSLATEDNQLMFIKRYFEENIPFDYWWMDAGWYPTPTGWWGEPGTWEPDPKRFPHGLRPVSDLLHKQGSKTILWFAPEVVAPGTWIYENHPEWLLGNNGTGKMLNFGNLQAMNWLINHIAELIVTQGIDTYRQDGGPVLSFWRANDAEDRQGITEIRHVEGYLKFWDTLRRRFPNLHTDICCGGGSRDDLETLRRAVPLWRSDYAYETTGMQNLTYGIAMWIPYFGDGTNALDSYSFHSQMAPAISCIWDLRRHDLDYTLFRRFLAQWRQVSPNYYGDYYPLTPYRTENDIWMAWQFNRPEAGEGMIQAFRRPGSAIVSQRFKLHGLDPRVVYRVRNLDSPNQEELTGLELMEQGLQVSLLEQPGSAVVVYQRL